MKILKEAMALKIGTRRNGRGRPGPPEGSQSASVPGAAS